MDFELSDDQQALAGLAAKVIGEHASHERLRALETGGGPRFDRALWSELASTGLLGTAIPESHGGAGLGFFELALLIEQVGRHAAPVPVIETCVLGALAIGEFGGPALREAILPGVVEGRLVLTAALTEDLADPERPTTLARPDGAAHRLRGRKICVPAGSIASHAIVPASGPDDEVLLFLVDLRAEGVAVTPVDTTNGQPDAGIAFDDVRVTAAERLGEPRQGGAILTWIRERGTAAYCSLALGVCEEALRLTAEYTKSRKQFGEPIATFQAVGQRQADAYVDTEAIRLTSWQAAWRIANGLPATTEVAVAKYWAARGGQRVVHTCVHQHGGIGVDRDYPLHRAFLYAKQLELALGGSSHQLRRIGRMLADQPVA